MKKVADNENEDKPDYKYARYKLVSDIISFQHRYTLLEILPIFINVDRESDSLTVSPSVYNYQMSYPTKRRLDELMQQSRKCDVLEGRQTKPPKYYQPTPRIVIFQNFTPGEVYNATLYVRNSLETLKPLRMDCEKNRYFIVKNTEREFKIALGMTATFHIEFRPASDRDFSYKIEFWSGDEMFVVPVIGIGNRPMIDIPDEIYIPAGPVKVENSNVFTAKNIGKVRAAFSILAESPISITPSQGILDPDEMMIFTASVQTNKLDIISQEIIIHFDTGETLVSRVLTECINSRIFLNKSSISLEDTFLGMKRTSSLSILNGSDFMVYFKWRKMLSEEEEGIEKLRLKSAYALVQEMETKKSFKLENFDVIDHESHVNVYSRIYDDEIKALKNEEFLFTHHSFSIFPLSGEIWPHGHADITVVFEPDLAMTHTAKAYCDVTGREKRLPLLMTAVGLGPKIALNMTSLDTDYICLSATHCYQVVAKNVGLIPGTIHYIPSEIKCGGTISCSPETHHLNPEELGTFILTFSTSVHGKFKEDILFTIIESSEIIELHFLGKTVSPTLTFDVKFVDIGEVAFGFPTDVTIKMQNLSVVPVVFKLSVMGDGFEPSLTYKEYGALKHKPSLPVRPREFTVQPKEGVMEPYSCLKVVITLIPNIVRSHEVVLKAEIRDSQSGPLLIPITYAVKFPEILCYPSDINIRFCFINYPYTRSLVLENVSSTPGFFYIVPQQVTSFTSMAVSTPSVQGILKPKSKMKIPLTIMTNQLGKQSVSMSMIVFGEEKPKVICNLVCNGQGPVVSVDPHQLNFGEVRLLEEVSMELTLTNDSPVPADFMASIGKIKSPWKSSPQKGVLYAEESITLKITVELSDTGSFTDFVQIQVHNSRTLIVNMSAVGFGTSLVVEPPICPEYKLGALFTNQLIQRNFLLKNKGTKHHQIVWSSLKEIKEFARATLDIVADTIFRIIPMKMELGSGESQMITLEGRCDVVKQVSETFYCHAIVNAAHSTNKKQVLFNATFTANFIEPKVAFSKPQLNFRIDVGPEDELHLLQETVQVRNSSDLPHIIDFHIESPFTIMDENGELISDWSVPLEGLAEVSVTVVFDPSYRTDQYSRRAHGYLWVRYHEHPHMDSIMLIGEVNFPNIKFTPSIIDFGCIPVGSEACQDLKITNLSPLPVTFSWYWQEESVSIQHSGPVTVLPKVASEYQFTVEEEEDSQDSSSSESKVGSPVVVEEELCVTNLAQEPEEHLEDMAPEKKTSDIKSLEIKSSEEKLPENPSSEVSPEKPQEESNNVSVINAPEDIAQNAEHLSQLKKKLFPMINCYFTEEAEIKCLEGLPTVSPVVPEVNKLFEITPFYGTLEPYESQILSVSFNGCSFLSGEAIAICQVEGGPTETIKFKGLTSNICYQLDKIDIDFGWQVFCNICEEVITLSNFGLVGFDFNASTLSHPPDSPLEPGVVTVEPQSGHLEGQTEIQLIVRYLPGLSGQFQKTFQLEIGYLDPISLTVTGFGVFPQLYVCLPQPESYVTPVDIGYKAIDNLTPYWFAPKRKLKISNNIMVPMHSRPIPASEVKELLSHRWVIITFQDCFPTRADINLAVEREMAFRVIASNPGIVLRHVTMTKCKPILQFIAPPYDIDLGIVIVGTAVSFSAIMYNYGPVLVSSCLSCPQGHAHLKEAGIFLKVRDVKDLPIGQTAAMHVFFNPLYEQYPEKIKEIEFTFYLDIFHGPRIPVVVHGTVTVPFVTLSADNVNFGFVKYGECKEMSVIVKNEGLVPCTWQASLQFRQKKKKNNTIKIITYDDEEPVFRFQCEKNSLSPNEEMYIELFFEPATLGMREMDFVITMNENPQRLCIPLLGVGMLPTVLIMESVLEFEPQLPHAQGQELEFYIENPCNYPIEIFFKDYDTQILDEERIFRILCHYYQTDQMLIPSRQPGDKLPVEITDFYQSLMDDVSIKIVRQKEQEEKSRVPEEVPVTEESKKVKKKPGSKLQVSLSRYSTGGVNGAPKIPPVESPLLNKPPDEVEQLLHEHVDELQQSQDFRLSRKDPVKAAIEALRGKYKEPDVKEGFVIAFYGAPHTDYIAVAHKTAKALGIKVLSIDQIIFEAAVSDYSIEAMRIREIINNTYNDQTMFAVSIPEESETEPEKKPSIETLETIMMKVKCLEEKLGSRKTGGDAPPKGRKTDTAGTNQVRGTASSQRFSQHSNRTSSLKKSPFVEEVQYQNTLAGIPAELFTEIIRKRLQMPDCKKGVVIDNISSIFFLSVPSCLTTLLTAVGNIRYIHCILIMNNFKRYSDWMEAKIAAAEMKSKADYEAKLEFFETLTPETAEDLKGSDLELYNKLQLQRRKDKMRHKKEEQQRILQEKLLKEQLKKTKQQTKKQQQHHKKGTPDLKKHRQSLMRTALPETDSLLLLESDKPRSSPSHHADDSKRKGMRHKQSEMGKHTDDEDRMSRHRHTAKAGSIISEAEETVIELPLSVQFGAFFTDFYEMLPILENWDRKKGSVLTVVAEKPVSQPITLKGKAARRSKRTMDINARSRITLVAPEIAYPSRKSTESVLVLPVLEPIPSVIGVTTWMMDYSDLDNTKEEIIISMLKESADLKEAIAGLEEEPLKPKEDVMYLCINYPDIRKKTPVSDVFTLISPEPEQEIVETVDSSEDTTEMIEKTASSTIKKMRRRRESKRKRPTEAIAETKKEERSSANIQEVVRSKSRWILAPQERLYSKIQFQPSQVGEYTHGCEVEIMDTGLFHRIISKGLCDIPRLDMDPYVLYPSVCDTKDQAQHLYRLTYFKDTMTFEFGATVCAKSKDKRLYNIATVFSISNCSTLPAEVHFSFFDKTVDRIDAFGIEPNVLIVQPGEKQPLSVFACPHVLGTTVETLVCSIKNNPVLEYIKISCLGVKIDFDVDPKNISFEHILLYRKDFRILTLVNKSLVPLIWHFLGVETIQDDFTVSDTEGLLMPLNKQEVRFDYSADEVQPFFKRQLKLEVFDEEGRGESLFTEMITLSAEAIDVMVDVLFVNEGEDYVNFGKVKVGSEYQQPFQLRNKGKYDIVCKVEVEVPAETSVPHLDQMISVLPANGTVMHGDKPFLMMVSITPFSEFEFFNLPLLKCYLLDRTTEVAVIPIGITIGAFYCKYKVSPLPDINFGAVLLGSKKSLQLNIENTGIFELRYSVTRTPKPGEDDPKKRSSIHLSTVSRKSEHKKQPERAESRASTAVRKGRSKMTVRGRKDASMAPIRGGRSVKDPADANFLRVGEFTVAPFTGTIPPRESSNVNINFGAENEGSFSEEIVILVSEESPKEKEGTAVQLMGIACMPAIDINDIDSIFQEHFICQTLSEHRCPTEIGAHCVYLKDEATLLFCQTAIGTKATARLRIRNPGLVTSEVTPTIFSSGTRSSKSTEVIFTLGSTKVFVPPYTTEILEVSFAPILMETYTAHMELSMDVPSPSKVIRLPIKLCGEGCVPSVTIIKPETTNKNGQSTLMFEPTILRKKVTQEVVLKNTGIMPCEVIVELINPVESAFYLYPSEETIPMLKVMTANEPVKGAVVARVFPETSATFIVKFEPYEVGRHTNEIKIFIIDNPFENLVVLISGDGYTEDFTIDGLTTLFPILKQSGPQKQSAGPVTSDVLHYLLDFGPCFINKNAQLIFSLTNHSLTDTYRFEWPDNAFVSFCPSIGHIQPNTSKEITATFLSNEATVVTEEYLECVIVKITYPGPVIPQWDNRIKATQWIYDTIPEHDEEFPSAELDNDKCEFLQKYVETDTEPDHEVIAGTVRTFPLLVNALVDYPQYQCKTDKIEFKETLMFLTRNYEFTLSNTGTVPVHYNWYLQADMHQHIAQSASSLTQKVSAQMSSEETYHSAPGTPATPEKQSLPSLPEGGSLPEKLSLQTVELVDLDPERETIKNVSSILHEPQPLPENEEFVEFPLTQSEDEIEDGTPRETASDLTLGYVPFHINPTDGIVLPGEEQCFVASFQPLGVGEFHATFLCRIAHKEPETQPLKIEFKGTSTMPLCHFDVEDSDYISSGRRNPTLPGPFGMSPQFILDPNMKVLEFKVLGIGDTHTKEFYMINPTESNYSFIWQNIDGDKTKPVSAFQCLTPEGRVESGKQTKIQFSFMAQDIGTFESFWNFCIPKHNIEVPFMVVATVTEPAVMFVGAHIALNPTIQGIVTTKTAYLLNSDDVPAHFHFITSSLYTEGRQQSLKVSPVSGEIQPSSEISFQLEFTPTIPGESHFTLKCNIKGMKNPLTLSVSGQCFSVQPVVTYELEKTKIYNLNSNTVNMINIGELVPRHPVSITFRLTNIGKTSFLYLWDYDENLMRRKKLRINFREREGHVTSQSRIVSTMNFMFLERSSVDDFHILLKIKRGPEYTIALKANAVQPSVQFSFSEYNFGLCLCHATDPWQYTTTLTVTNLEDKPVVLESIFTDTPDFSVKFKSDQILPEMERNVTITFTPRECRKYAEKVEFIINGSFKKIITLSGEGVDVKVSLLQNKDKQVDLGVVYVGCKSTVEVPVKNHTRIPVSILFSLQDYTRLLKRSDSQLNTLNRASSSASSSPRHSHENRKELSKVSLRDHSKGSSQDFSQDFSKDIAKVLSITPDTAVLVRSHEVVRLVMDFSPTSRMKPFSEKVNMVINGKYYPLCLVKGSCIGPEFSFDRNYLPFGAVIENCSSVLKLLLRNTGDIGSKFAWCDGEWTENFRITPRNGYCSPDTVVTFTVEFSPKKQQHFRTVAECNLESFTKLSLILSGSCEPLPPPIDTLIFKTPVREQDKKTIMLANRNSVNWELFPVFSGDYFHGNETVSVPSQNAKPYDVVYSPLRMTDENKHTGTVFFQLPEGQGLLYQLIGTAEPPLICARISHEVPAKSTHTVQIPVTNWLHVPQRFRADIELIKSEKYDPVIKLDANTYIDVMGNSEKDFSFSFSALRECTVTFKVTFLNEKTEEYQFFEVTFRVVKGNILDVIKLTTFARHPTTHRIKIENPLPIPVHFNVNCTSPDVQCLSTPTIPPKSKKSVLFEYLPLQAGESSARLELISNDLGIYPYDLNLTAIAAPPEKPLKFTAPLGGSSVIETYVSNLTKGKVDFYCKVDNPDFRVEKVVSGAASHKATIEVTFEPSSLGNSQGTLSVTSVAGDFFFPLYGVCTLPKPQGPFIIRPGTALAIPFKNIFNETKTFSMYVDQPLFTLKNSSETAKARKDFRINITMPSMKSMERLDPKYPIAGKLVVASNDPNIKWVFYIKGILDQ